MMNDNITQGDLIGRQTLTPSLESPKQESPTPTKSLKSPKSPRSPKQESTPPTNNQRNYPPKKPKTPKSPKQESTPPTIDLQKSAKSLKQGSTPPTIDFQKSPKGSPPPTIDLQNFAPILTNDTKILYQFMENQPIVNVGTIGHVAHGKSTLVEALTSIKTAKFDSELERNMTIRLGYANAKIWKCSTCPDPSCFSSSNSKLKNFSCSHCLGPMTLVHHVSFVDCPGHDVLMATMLNGAAVMDAAFLLVAANEPCPLPQTREHLVAVELMGLKKMAILQNKVDLVKEEKALENYTSIKDFSSRTYAHAVPVIPISAQRKLNLDVVCKYLANLPVPERNLTDSPRMTVVRSFDVNKPGATVDELVGGVAGGTLLRGSLEIGQRIEVRPGVVWIEKGTKRCRPLLGVVLSMSSENNRLPRAVPGGLIAVATTIDPSLTRADRLVGHILGVPGEMPEVYDIVEISYSILKRVVGLSDEDHVPDSVRPLKNGETLKINIGSATTNATVKKVVDRDRALLSLEFPCCADVGEKVSISRKVKGHWRLVGFGKLREGSVPMNLEETK